MIGQKHVESDFLHLIVPKDQVGELKAYQEQDDYPKIPPNSPEYLQPNTPTDGKNRKKIKSLNILIE